MSSTSAANSSSVDAGQTAGEARYLSVEDWGKFYPYRAAMAIRAMLKGNAQHIALFVALKTPQSGVVTIRHNELARETGRHFRTIPEAMAECERVGLLTGRRTREGYVYTWLKVAYQPTEEMRVCRRAENASSTEVDALRQSLRPLLWPTYFRRLASCHKIPADSPRARELGLIASTDENRILENVAYFAKWLVETNTATTQDVAQEALDRSLERWFEQKGQTKPGESTPYLVRMEHPLRCFAEDCSRLIPRLMRLPKHTTNQIVPKHEQHDRSDVAKGFRQVTEGIAFATRKAGAHAHISV